MREAALTQRADPIREAGPRDDAARRGDPDGVCQRRAGQMGIEERHRQPRPREAEPDREVIRAVLHEQADDLAGLQTLGKCPTGVAACGLRQGAVAERRLRRNERGRRLEALGERIDSQRESGVGVALDGGGALEGSTQAFRDERELSSGDPGIIYDSRMWKTP